MTMFPRHGRHGECWIVHVLCLDVMCGSLPKKSAYPHFVTPSSAFRDFAVLGLAVVRFSCSPLLSTVHSTWRDEWSSKRHVEFIMRHKCLSVTWWWMDRRPSVSGSENPHPPPIFFINLSRPLAAFDSPHFFVIVNLRHSSSISSSPAGQPFNHVRL